MLDSPTFPIACHCVNFMNEENAQLTLSSLPYPLLFSESQIKQCVSSMGRTISPWIQEVNAKNPRGILCLPVLRGAFFFAADLLRAIPHSTEIVPIRARAYRSESNDIADQVELEFYGVDAKDRTILVIDDICDSGRTMQVISSELVKAGAKEIKSAVFMHRVVDCSFSPHYVGFSYGGNEWIVGYGMDDADKWRNLPYAGIITPQASNSEVLCSEAKNK